MLNKIKIMWFIMLLNKLIKILNKNQNENFIHKT